MIYRHTFDPVALDEYKQAITWYGERSARAADQFISAVADKIIDICNAPTLYRNRYKKTREIALKKFPYSIVYFINEESKIVIIASVYHHSRNPKRKYTK